MTRFVKVINFDSKLIDYNNKKYAVACCSGPPNLKLGYFSIEIFYTEDRTNKKVFI